MLKKGIALVSVMNHTLKIKILRVKGLSTIHKIVEVDDYLIY